MRLPGYKLNTERTRFIRWLVPAMAPYALGGLFYFWWPSTFSDFLFGILSLPILAVMLTVYIMVIWDNWRNPRLYVVAGMMIGGASLFSFSILLLTSN